MNQTVLSRVLKIKGIYSFSTERRLCLYLLFPFFSSGYVVEIANNGAEGIERYRSAALAGTWFDVVFMDLQMPVMDGLACTELIRKFEIEVCSSSLASPYFHSPFPPPILHSSSPSCCSFFSFQMGRAPALIIGLSGNARDEYKLTALAAGMNECILTFFHLPLPS